MAKKAKMNVKHAVGIAAIVLVIVVLAGLFATLFVKLDRQTTTTTIGGEVYSVGTLDDEGEYEKGDTSIYMRKAITTDGLTCELEDDAKITYEIFFYDKKGNFLSKTGTMTGNFPDETNKVPEGATQAKIVITPTDDDEVSLVEVLGYAAQLKVTVNK
jgi:hypothetical protein